MKPVSNVRWLYLLGIILLAGFAIKSIVAVTSMAYDWDIDHELYYGQQLAVGKLIYTAEYHDKLPFGTIFMVLPTLLNGFQAWATQSLVLLLGGACSVSMIMSRLIADQRLKLGSAAKRGVLFLVFSSYLFLMAFLPGNISHINPLSANLALYSTVILLYSGRFYPAKKSLFKSFSYVSASLFAAMAISIRPYYAPALISSALWISVRTHLAEQIPSNALIVNPMRIQLVAIFRDLLVWLAFVCLAGLLINGLPYLITGQWQHFVDGILHNSQKLNPEPIQSIIEAQLTKTSPLFVLSVLTLAYPCYRLFAHFVCFNTKESSLDPYQKIRDTDLIMGTFVPCLLLELAILSRHYWPHYQQLFVPFLVLSIGLGMAHAFGHKWRYIPLLRAINLKASVRTLCILLVVSMLVPVFWMRLSTRNTIPGEVFIASIGAHHEHQLMLNNVSRMINERKSLGHRHDFLFVDSMYIHWKLRESRHGFPHSANIGHIQEGWWDSRSERKRVIDYPYTKSQMCEKLYRSGPTLIYVSEGSFVEHCLSSAPNIYQMTEDLGLGTIAFERAPNSDSKYRPDS